MSVNWGYLINRIEGGAYGFHAQALGEERLADVRAKVGRASASCAPVVDIQSNFDQILGENLNIREVFSSTQPPWPVFWTVHFRGRGRRFASIQLWECAEAGLGQVLQGMVWQYTKDDGSIVGPVHMSIADIDEQGVPTNWSAEGFADIPESQIEELKYEMGLDVAATLGALELLNCSNVELIDTPTSRQVARNEMRTMGRRTQVIAVSASTKRRTVSTVDGLGDSTPKQLHSVRGHIAHYGDCCPTQHEPRGKLFGKKTARIWVPMHARGVGEGPPPRQNFKTTK